MLIKHVTTLVRFHRQHTVMLCLYSQYTQLTHCLIDIVKIISSYGDSSLTSIHEYFVIHITIHFEFSLHHTQIQQFQQVLYECIIFCFEQKRTFPSYSFFCVGVVDTIIIYYRIYVTQTNITKQKLASNCFVPSNGYKQYYCLMFEDNFFHRTSFL